MGGRVPRGDCTASAPAWRTVQAPPISGPPRPLCTSPCPQPASHSPYVHAHIAFPSLARYATNVSSGDDSYRYDVFVSYPQRGSLPQWVSQVLKPLLEEKLEEAGLHDMPRVFVDTQSLNKPGDWPIHLSDAHARSRIIVPVLCAPYFQSGWCTSEWTNAFKREELELQRTGKTLSLVHPLRFNDLSESDIDKLTDVTVRDQVRARIRRDFGAFTCLVNPRGDTDSAYAFRKQVESFCQDILLPAIEAAPLWQPDWPRLPKKPILGRDPSWAAGM